MSMIEVDLLAKSKQGDVASFQKLIESYTKRVYNILYRILGDEEDAKDIAQEVFIKVYTKLHTFNEKSEFYTWLYRITINTAKDFSKRKKDVISVDYLNDVGYEFTHKEGSNPETAFVEVERREAILQALMELSQKQREIIVLRDIHGLSYEEISNIYNIGIGTVKSRISRARLRMREFLRESPEFLKGR